MAGKCRNMKSMLNIAGCALAFACSTSTTPVQVQLPSSLSIASITVAGTPQSNTWTPDNSIAPSLSCASGAPLIVDIAPQVTASAIEGFTLETPGNCGSLVSCGWLKLSVTPSDGTAIEVATALTPISVDGVDQPGSYSFTLELHDASDNVLHRPDGSVVGDQEDIDFTEPTDCSSSNPGDAG